VSQAAPYHSYTYREYLALEESANVKHEFFNGEIYAMAGGTPEHAALAAAIISSLVAALKGGTCRVYSSDLRVRVLATGLTTYPDVSVVCGELERDPDNQITVTNPTVLVEVLSDSTAAYDRGEKLEQYKQIDPLKAVVLFSQHSHRAELHVRSGTRWHTEVFTDNQSVPLTALGVELSLASVYADAGL
jgi:Uma2 family endonuclease